MSSVQKIGIFLMTFLLLAAVGMAQPGKPSPNKVIPIAKFKPPKVKTYWGRNSDSAWITKEEARQLIDLPIKISDAKNVSYTISSYQFMYRKNIVTEDEATGKVLPSTELKIDRFTASPLPPIWRENIKPALISGEMLYYFDIIVKDAQGRLFFAPELKIYIR